MRKTWRESAARVAAMSWGEVRARLRQEAAKRSDRLVYGLGIHAAARELQPLNGHRRQGAAVAAAPKRSGRFFFDPSDVGGILTLLRERFASDCASTIEQAERISNHRFDILGFRDLDYGPEIDWHLDPVNQKRPALRPWYQIRYLAFDEAGDHKIVWELNRHQHLVTMAKAHLLTRETRYLAELLAEWTSWQKANPYPLGINWASSLEVAFRSLSWLWLGHLLSSSAAAPASFQKDLARSLALNGHHIERYLSTYSSPNTHLLGEAVALFSIGALCPRLRSAERWREAGWRIILEESARQVRADGMHFEQSIYYHVYALDFFLHARILAARNGLPIPAELDRAIQKMLEALVAISQAGVVPRFGDDDGGRVFDPRRNRREHLLDPLSTGAALYERGDFKFASGRLKEETLWLLGPEGVRRFDALPASTAPAISTALGASGFYVMASSTEAGLSPAGGGTHPRHGELLPSAVGERRQLVIDAGQQGMGNSGHGHADALSVHLSIDAHEWLADPGSFRYISPGRDRDRYRSTPAHNTLVVDGLSQAEPAGPFAWESLPRTRADLWVSGSCFDLFLGSHTGYKRLERPLVHRRWVFYLKPDFWMVRDIAEGYGEHALEVFWHFGERFAASFTPPGFTLMKESSHGGLSIVPVEGHRWSQEVCRGFISPAYGIEEPAPVVRFAASRKLPADFAVVLQPVAELPERLGRLKRTESPQATAYWYHTGAAQHVMLFSNSAAQSPWELGSVKCDARFVYLGLGANEGALQLALAGGSSLEIDGRPVIRCDRPAEWCEVIGSMVHCSDPGAAVEMSRENLARALEEMASE